MCTGYVLFRIAQNCRLVANSRQACTCNHCGRVGDGVVRLAYSMQSCPTKLYLGDPLVRALEEAKQENWYSKDGCEALEG
jgi:hypothetical protein